MKANSIVSPVALMMLLCFGCCSSPVRHGAEISYNDDYFPDKLKHTHATLKLGNMDLRAELSLIKSDQTIIIQAIKEGIVLDEEIYRVTTEGVWLLQIGEGEEFEPGITLLKYPMKIGDKFDWKGHLVYGNRKIKSDAVVTTRTETISLATGSAEAVKSEVVLKIHDGSPTPAERKLDIWFVKGEGPVKRDFGNRIREPRTKTQTSNEEK